MKFAKIGTCAGVMLALCASAANASTIINIDGTANASMTGTTAVQLTLGPGTYSLTPIIDQFTAFKRFSGATSCDGLGENCVQGWEYSYKVSYDSTVLSFGDGFADGGFGPLTNGNAYYDTAIHAFNSALAYSPAFTLSSTKTVNFWILDDFLADNTGGVSLELSAGVPEPATWAMFLLGFGAVGFAMRRSLRKIVVPFA